MLAPPPAVKPRPEAKKNAAAAPFPKAAKANQPKAEAVPPAPVSGEADAPKDGAGNLPLIKRRFAAENSTPNSKVRVEDVKYVPRVMGPLEEIKYLDITNFRRLASEPAKIIEKIKDKINLLGEAGYEKKFSGIKAWRQSPVYALYLEIGNLSISENKPIDVIIEEKKIRGEEYLTGAEFEAIMDLNKDLRF